jgi:hypothetical protein
MLSARLASLRLERASAPGFAFFAAADSCGSELSSQDLLLPSPMAMRLDAPSATPHRIDP